MPQYRMTLSVLLADIAVYENRNWKGYLAIALECNSLGRGPTRMDALNDLQQNLRSRIRSASHLTDLFTPVSSSYIWGDYFASPNASPAILPGWSEGSFTVEQFQIREWTP